MTILFEQLISEGLGEFVRQMINNTDIYLDEPEDMRERYKFIDEVIKEMADFIVRQHRENDPMCFDYENGTTALLVKMSACGFVTHPHRIKNALLSGAKIEYGFTQPIELSKHLADYEQLQSKLSRLFTTASNLLDGYDYASYEKREILSKIMNGDT